MIISSDNSLKYFPNNEASHFTFRSPYEIQLQGKWKVALVEIHFPETFLHISDDNCIELDESNNKEAERITNFLRSAFWDDSGNIQEMNIDNDDSTFDISSLKGIYNSVETLLEQINYLKDIQGHLKFILPHGNFVKVKKVCEEKKIHVLNLSSQISFILGSKQIKNIQITDKNGYTFDFPASISNALPSAFFIYSDICESYITGDVQASLLRRISLDTGNYHYGTNKTKEFSWLQYLPVQRNEFLAKKYHS